jgi:prolyl 4-hydroxylase
MNHTTRLSPQWQRWIDDNLARGCSSASMVASMTQAGLDATVATAAIQHAARPSAEPAPALPSDFGAVAADAAAHALQTTSYVYQTPRLPQSGKLIRTHDRDVHVALRLARPVVALFDNFMSHAECDALIGLARAKLTRSAIVDPLTGQSKVIDHRSSYGTFFHLNENDFIARLDRRIAEVMHWPIDNGEGIQILHYPVGGEYTAHFDYFPPEEAGSAAHLARGGQRVSTLVMYLNDVEEGGETSFPSIHLSITPKKGAAAYFEYGNSLGQVDPLSLHAGCPVLAGEKWIATKWMRERRYG